jgi:hypothetical protein
MESGSWPLDPVSAAALLVRVIDEIDDRSEEETDAMLGAMLCAAWGSILAQNQ